MKNLFISILILLAAGNNAYAQEKTNKELKGDKYYFVYSFDEAIDSYKSTNKLTIEGQRRLAESYANIERNVESEEAYLKLVNTPGGNLPEDYYNYAMVLKTNGKYTEARIWMDKFKDQKPNDLRAKDYVANKTGLANMSTDDGKYKIKQQEMNTDASDFAPSYYKDKIVFSSSRATPKMIVKKYNWTRKPFLDMYVADIKDGQLENIENFSKTLNSKMHDGLVSFSNNDTYLAFTKNNYDDKSKDKIIEVQIYFSNYKDGKWSEAVPFILNGKGYSVGHPCLTANGNTLYFASDMPGGYGAADLYRISKDANGVWGAPENLGNKVNTEGDEMFPFLEEKSDLLFFASNGRYGLGGLDIFITEIRGKGYGRTYNAGYPLNTQSDDFALIVNADLTLGYFSSNRTGGQGDDDIYAVDILKKFGTDKKIVGTVRDKNDNSISNALVTLRSEKGIVLDTFITKNDGIYSFYVAPDKRFELTGEKEKYNKATVSAGTYGTERIIQADMVLFTNDETIVQDIVIGSDLASILKLKSIYFDYDKFDIRADAEKELKLIVKILNDNPNMSLKLSSHADCRAPKQYNQELSDKRAVASAQYLKQRVTKPERIQSKGYGETQHTNGCSCEGKVISDCEEDEYQKDRRTEFIVVSK